MRSSEVIGIMPDIWVATAEGVLRNGDDELPGPMTALERHGDSWWAIVDHKEIRRRHPSGEWRTVASNDAHPLNCLLPLDDRVLAGTSEAHLVRIADDAVELVESFEVAEGRNDWYTPWGGPPDVRSIAADDSGAIFVNVHVGGILRSVDGG
ncbi:MAG: hypothetical protein ACRDJI_03000 [Actinomycetota bacterium]